MLILLGLLLTSSAHASSVPQVNPLWGKETFQCHAKDAAGAKRVWIFKQWHPAPEVNTRDLTKAKALPQRENLEFIYRQLDSWIRDGKLGALVAEGCSGEITPASNLRVNGWEMP